MDMNYVRLKVQCLYTFSVDCSDLMLLSCTELIGLLEELILVCYCSDIWLMLLIFSTSDLLMR